MVVSVHECNVSMGAGRGQFTAAIEVQEQRRLILSFLHHMAVQRLCKNPLEDEEVVGITNYLDIGLQAIPSTSSGSSSGSQGGQISSGIVNP